MSDSDTPSDAGGLSETTARLRERLGSAEGNGTSPEAGDNGDRNGGNDGETGSSEDAESENDTDLADAAKLVTRTEAALEDLLGILQGDREGTLEEAQDDVENLIEVIDEAEDVLSTVNLSALPDAVEWSDLPKAIEARDVPEAIAKGEVSEAVKFRKLLQIVNLRQVLGNVDLRSFRQQKDELEDAADDDGAEEDGASNILDRFKSDDDGADSEATGDAGDSIGLGVMGGDGGDEGDEGGGIPSELIQTKVQSKLGDAIDQFRDSALDARDRLSEMREHSKEEFREKTDRTGQPFSRNPTAYSTLPPPPDDRVDLGGVARFSTMSRTPRHSSAPGRDHIYGDRFENRNQKDKNDE